MGIPASMQAFKALFCSFPSSAGWFICGILGGGFGNLIDRFFRSEGVVDFIDVKFYGLFGLERWPTFNIADAAIVVCAFGLFIMIFLQERKEKRTQHAKTEGKN